MLKKASTKKRRWIGPAVAGVLTVSIVAGALYNTSEEAYAKASLKNIEKINQENGKSNPFTILEIVPQYKDARMGYLVAEQEPVFYDDNKVLATADMASKEERAERYPATAAAFVDPNHGFPAFSELKDQAFTFGDFTEDATNGTKTFNAYGTFEENANTTGDYKDSRSTASNYKKIVETDDPLDPDSTYTFSEVLDSSNTSTTGIVYVDEAVYDINAGLPTSATDERYNLSFKFYSAKDPEEDRPFKTTQSTIDSTVYDFYNWSFFLTNETAPLTPVIEYDPNDSTKIANLKLSDSLSADTAIYIQNSDEFAYYGYTYLDASDVLRFKSQDGMVDIAVDGYKATSTDPDTLANNLYTSTTINLFTIREYDDQKSEDTARNDQRLYIKQVSLNSNNTGFVTQELIAKNVRIRVGDDPVQFGIDVNDDMSYHTFFCMEANTKEFNFVPGASKTGSHDFAQSYGADIADTFKYNGGFTNNEWFKQYVLDLESGSECSNAVVDVVTKLADQVTVDDVNNASLIYIRGGDYTKVKDMAPDVAKAILSSISDSKAVIVEGNGLYTGTYDGTVIKTSTVDSNPLTNLNTLAVMLEQPNMNATDITAYVNGWANVDTYRATRADDTQNKSYVINTLYVYNNTTAGYDSVVNVHFKDTINSSETLTVGTIALGYSAVQTDIDNEKFYLSVAGSTASFNDQISIATCIRHILNYGKRRTASKDSLRVLDIEPFYSQLFEDNTGYFLDSNGKGLFDLENGRLTRHDNVDYDASSRDIMTKAWLKSYVGTQIRDDDKISIRGMGTREFIGNIDDLNSDYDLIYIGLDTEYINTDIQERVKTTNTVYNDSGMNGLVYTHVGDSFRPSGQRGSNDSIPNAPNSLRGSGDDITFEKTRDLMNYIKAGYAVIFSTDFYTYDGSGRIQDVNTSKVDANSYMYDLAKWAIQKDNDGNYVYMGKNVSVKKNFDGNDAQTTTGKTTDQNREDFSKYLNIQKLILNVMKDSNGNDKVPAPYFIQDPNDPSNQTYQYLAMDANGLYSLDFEIELTNDAAVDTSHTSYDCKLYIDHDADGRFEDVEALNGISIEDTSGNSALFEDGVYKLTTGKTYKISRRVPEEYVGFLAWKLEFVENDSSRSSNNRSEFIKTSIQGYSAVPDFSRKPDIHVLQITNGSGQTNLDLTSNDMKELYKEVKDFNLIVDKISAQNFVTNPNQRYYTGSKYDYLMSYDMVVMGFYDSFDFWDIRINEHTNDWEQTTEAAVYAIRKYILSGKSMLFTHDLNSKYMYQRNPSGYLANMYLRDLQGMDRYGITQGHLAELESHFGAFGEEYSYKSRYDNDDYKDIFGNDSKKVENLGDKDGWNTTSLMRWHYDTGNVSTGLGDVSLRQVNDNFQYAAPGYETNHISVVNRGQITDYPFHIEDEIEVANTHAQYFQLNLDTDSLDDNYDDDIVVWFTLSNQSESNSLRGYYTFDYNDCRNNYYIYNKGNITYTGAGHRAVTGLDERKLFVNTLVAAYNAGDHAPVVKYKESAWDMAADINAMYEPYDLDLRSADDSTSGGFIEDEITINFKTINNNLQNNTVKNEDGSISYKTIKAQYYVQVSDPTGAIKIGEGADAKYYKILDPTKFTIKKVVDSNNITLPSPVELTDKYTLENYTIYTMKVKMSEIMGTSGGTDENGNAILKLNRHNANVIVRLSMDTETSAMNQNLKGLPATDSMTPLAINFTELYELQ